MGRKSEARGSVGWTKVRRWWVEKQTDGFVLDSQMPVDNDRQN